MFLLNFFDDLCVINSIFFFFNKLYKRNGKNDPILKDVKKTPVIDFYLKFILNKFYLLQINKLK